MRPQRSPVVETSFAIGDDGQLDKPIAERQILKWPIKYKEKRTVVR